MNGHRMNLFIFYEYIHPSSLIFHPFKERFYATQQQRFTPQFTKSLGAN